MFKIRISSDSLPRIAWNLTGQRSESFYKYKAHKTFKISRHRVTRENVKGWKFQTLNSPSTGDANHAEQSYSAQSLKILKYKFQNFIIFSNNYETFRHFLLAFLALSSLAISRTLILLEVPMCFGSLWQVLSKIWN